MSKREVLFIEVSYVPGHSSAGRLAVPECLDYEAIQEALSGYKIPDVAEITFDPRTRRIEWVLRTEVDSWQWKAHNATVAGLVVAQINTHLQKTMPEGESIPKIRLALRAHGT
jgi:hypothetical protein